MFDSYYDAYRGVISSVRVFNGVLRSGAKLRYVNARQDHDAEEIGVRLPVLTPVATLGPGEVGYLIAGIKDVGEAKVGETVTDSGRRAEPLEGYRDPKPMVFCGLYPVDGDEYADLREALERLRLNDSSFTYEPETSGALGFGFRCGFLGLLHMEIIRERLEREYDLSLVATAPNVEYRVQLADGSVEVVDNPSSMPPPEHIEAIEEPFVRVTILTPTDYVGTLMELAQQRRGEMEKMEYLSEDRVELVYTLPLGEIVLDFFDQMKSRTRGYASLDYEPVGLPRVEPRQGRRAAQRRARRRVLGDRAPRQGRRVRPQDDVEAARAHPAPALRRADPGRDRRPDHRPRDGEGEAQGRARQVLRRRHHAQAQAARAPEGRQEADEADRPGRGAPGSLRRRAPPRRVTRRRSYFR